ncbi:MAG: hypothetical protein KatS3mg060_3409 [Dehalococcoidia bacterium]|nr:MAG: hypothetical protein KatS3mg060_3409 [Dehalococcoidia bacterium]
MPLRAALHSSPGGGNRLSSCLLSLTLTSSLLYGHPSPKRREGEIPPEHEILPFSSRVRFLDRALE